MFPHPEDLHRAHQLQHAEMIKNHARERQARAAHRPTRRRRGTGLFISVLVMPWHWWKGIVTRFTRRNIQTGTVTTALHNGTLPVITRCPIPLGTAGSSLAEPAPGTTLI